MDFSKILPLCLLLLFQSQLFSQNLPDRNACGFLPEKIESLTDDPAIQEIYKQMDEQIGILSRKNRKSTARSATSGVTFNVPVVVHLVYGSGTPSGQYSNMTDGQVQSLINALNDNLSHASGNTYANPFSGADAGIQLCLANKDPNDNPTNGIIRHIDNVNSTYNPSTQNVQNAYQWPKDDYLNIYYVENSPANYTIKYGLESIVCWGYTASVLTHEVGHFFGLLHVYNNGCNNGNCDTDGDRICDTPPSNTVGNGVPVCPPSPVNTCNTDSQDSDPRNPYRSAAIGGLGDVNDVLENYMYTGLACVEAFSQGQTERMRLILTGAIYDPLRSPYKLLESTKCGPVSPIVRQANPGNQLCTSTGIYQQTITFVYSNPPASGQLNVNGQLFDFSQDGTQSVDLTDLNADGNPVNVTVFFTAEPSSTFTFPNLFTAPTLGNCQVAPCEITQIELVNNFISCDPSRNAYGANFRVYYQNPPPGSGANLELYLNDTLAAQTVAYFSPTTLAIFLPADGQDVDVTARFTTDPSCSLTIPSMFTAPNPGCGPSNNCMITDLSIPINGQTACVPATNRYTQDVIVTYNDPPTSGTLIVHGQPFAIGTSPQTVTLSNLTSDGNTVNVTAYFSDNTACTYTENALFTAPQNCIPQPCNITDLSIPQNSQTACDPNSNTYTQQVIVTYANPPENGTLKVNGQDFAIGSSPQTITLVGLQSDGNGVNVTAYFSAEPTCTFTVNSLFTAPANCQCSIYDLSASTQSSCNPAGNTYTQNITVYYTNAPATGKLVINNQFFDITTSPQTETLIGLTANGGNVNVTAYFSSNAACTLTKNNLFTAPMNCEPTPCSFTSASLGAQSSCDPGTNTYSQTLTLFYSNPPSSGQILVNGQAFSITGSPQIVTLSNLAANGSPVNLQAYFSSDENCSLNIANFFTAPVNCEPCAITAINLGIQSVCDPQTNTFSQDVIVEYSNAPQSGFLTVNGQDFTISTSPQAITLTGLTSNGNALDITASFTANPSCTFNVTGLIQAPTACNDCMDMTSSPGIVIPASGAIEHIIEDIITIGNSGSILEVEVIDLDITHSFVGDLKVQLTSPAGTTVTLFDRVGFPGSPYGCGSDNVLDLRFDDDYAASSSVLENLCNPIVPALSGSFQPVEVLSAFEGENPQGDWTLTVMDKYPAADGGSLDKWDLRVCFTDADCEIIDLSAGNQSSCSPENNFYTQEVTITYVNPPVSGNLNVNGQLFAITGSPQTLILTDLISDGNPVDVTAFFTAENTCSLTEAGLFNAPQNCEPCFFHGIANGGQSSCDPLTNTYSQTLTISYVREPATGTLVVHGQHFPITGSPQTVVLTGLPADGQFFSIDFSFSDDPGCLNLLGDFNVIAPPSCASTMGGCNTLAAENVPLTIPSNFPGGIIVSSPIQIGATGSISDVDVINLDIDHSWVGDLSARLISPQGTSVELFNQIGTPASSYGCNGQNLSLGFDDDVFETALDLHNTCDGSPAAVGIFQPTSSLSAFDGESPTGTWTLEIMDLYPDADGGALKNWSLKICTGESGGCITTSTLQLNSIPIDPTVYSAANITAKGTVLQNLNTNNTFFRSQNSVMLEPEFEVQGGALLDIRIDPCICELSQFAVSATASSYWLGGGPLANSWFPVQATGTPDLRTCADSARAWAPETDGDIDEFLHLVYGTPVKVTGIRIWETWNDVNDGNGFVTMIEAVDLNNVKHTIWQGQDDTPCGSIFNPNITPTDFLVDEIIIHTKRLGYEQIDAVELTGVECDP